MPQKGTTISETYTTTTTNYAGGLPFIGTFVLGTEEQVAVVELRAVGVSTDGNDKHVAREQRVVLKTGLSPSAVSVISENLIRNLNNLSNNEFPTAIVPLNASGNTWASTTAYSAGDYVETGGNIYLCITAGTSGSTAPTHTNGAALDGTVRWLYVGAQSDSQFVVCLSGENGVNLDWSADVKIITAN